jgi:hypothetical protein
MELLHSWQPVAMQAANDEGEQDFAALASK